MKAWVKEDANLEYPAIFQVVISVSNLMNSLQSLKDNMDSSTDEPQIESVAVVLLVDAVIADACVWVSFTPLAYYIINND